MKAAVCREFGKPLVIEEIELAEPGPGEIKVKIAACAICHSDIHYIDGAWGGDAARRLRPRGGRRRRGGRAAVSSMSSRAIMSW